MEEGKQDHILLEIYLSRNESLGLNTLIEVDEDSGHYVTTLWYIHIYTASAMKLQFSKITSEDTFENGELSFENIIEIYLKKNKRAWKISFPLASIISFPRRSISKMPVAFLSH